MRVLLRNQVLSLLAAVIIFTFGSCAKHETSVIEGVPQPQLIAEGGAPKTLPGGMIHKELRKISPMLKDIVVNDRSYIYITRAWFEELHGWTDRYIDRVAPDLGADRTSLPGYTHTYAMLMNSAANFALAKRYKLKTSVLIGFMVAKNDKPWEKLPGDGRNHNYLVGLTEQGWLVLDLGTGQVTTLAEFPNRKTMVAILF